MKQDNHEDIEKISSEHLRNWIRHTILLILTLLMTSSTIWRHKKRQKKRLLYTNNTLIYQWKNHIDVYNRFIHDYVEYGTAKIQFFRSEENMAYSITKILSNGPFEYLK